MDKLNVERLRALDEKATPGPYDTIPGSMVRALRGDVAVPMFESRCVIWDPANEGPTVRDSSGAVQMRKGSEGAKISHGMHREHANVELVAYLLNAVPAILAMAEENARWSEAAATIIARCEALEDEAHDMMAKADCSKTTSFYSGQKMTAKSLRRELHDLTRALGKDQTNVEG